MAVPHQQAQRGTAKPTAFALTLAVTLALFDWVDLVPPHIAPIALASALAVALLAW
jgi:hypothetical protein